MHPIEFNLVLLNEMMEEFEAFILSKELFWPLQRKSFANTPFPQLSLGALLLTLDELHALQAEMNPLQAQTYDEQTLKFERFSEKYRVAIENKAAREEITRTNLWRAFLEDMQEDPDVVDEYARQVRNRVLMVKLGRIASGDQVSVADQEIDAWIFLESDPVEFLWDKRLMPIFPIDDYPFLYVKPR